MLREICRWILIKFGGFILDKSYIGHFCLFVRWDPFSIRVKSSAFQGHQSKRELIAFGVIQFSVEINQ